MGAIFVERVDAWIALVSILAHPEGWALSHKLLVHSNRYKFQSSPTPKDGRYIGSRLTGTQSIGFNPRPPRRMGAMRGILP